MAYYRTAKKRQVQTTVTVGGKHVLIVQFRKRTFVYRFRKSFDKCFFVYFSVNSENINTRHIGS